MGTERDRESTATTVKVEGQAVPRRYAVDYKLSVIGETDERQQFSEIGALLSQVGLYWSNLSNWRIAAWRQTVPRRRRFQIGCHQIVHFLLRGN